MNKKKLLIAVVVAVVMLGGLAWALLPSAEDRQVAKVVELQEKLFSDQSRDMPSDERRQAFEELRTEAEKLTPETRMQMMRDHPPPFMRRMQENIVAYFDLPEDQRPAALDKAIDEMEQRRKEWEKRRAERGDRPPGERGPRGGPGGPGGAGGGPGGGRGGPPGGFNRNMTDEQRNQFRRRMLDNTSPQQRAMFGEYFKQLEQRRKERGLPPMRGPGPR